MVEEPFLLVGRQIAIGVRAPEALLVQLLVVVFVLVLQPAHRRIELDKQVRAVLADSEIEIG